MGLVTDYLERQYGCELQTVESNVVLGAAAPVRVLPSNPNRFGWTIHNLGAAIGYLGFTGAVTALNGIVLPANGGWRNTTSRDDGELTTYELWGLGAGATTLYITETIAV